MTNKEKLNLAKKKATSWELELLANIKENKMTQAEVYLIESILNN